jgi:hypothetical protein
MHYAVEPGKASHIDIVKPKEHINIKGGHLSDSSFPFLLSSSTSQLNSQD